MTVLVIGGTGTVGSRLVTFPRERGAPVRIASRTDPGDPDWTRFDWHDPATHGPALDGVRRAFVLGPLGEVDPRPVVVPFLERAGLERVALLGSSAVGTGEPGPGLLHEPVRDLAGVGTVLRPSWFLQNFLGAHHVAEGVRRGEIVSATGSGRIAFVDAADIAAVAGHVLTDDVERPGDAVLTGPEALSFADAAAILTAALGRPVVHRAVEGAELTAVHVDGGLDPGFAALLAGLDEAIAAGAEDRVTSTVRDITGREPRTFRDVVVSALLPGHSTRV